MNWIQRVWRGEVSLVVVFWLCWLLPTIAANGLLTMLSLPLAALGPFVAIGVMFIGLITLVAYQCVAFVGIWRSAARYSGWRPWAWLARGAVVLACASNALGVWASVRGPFRAHDPSRNSMNVASRLLRDPHYPLTGFWKESCTHSFGLAIEPATTPGIYSVSFCGPGGCFAPGTYRPDTAISGDPAYRVLDVDHIEVEGRDGFSKYTRCE